MGREGHDGLAGQVGLREPGLDRGRQLRIPDRKAQVDERAAGHVGFELAKLGQIVQFVFQFYLFQGVLVVTRVEHQRFQLGHVGVRVFLDEPGEGFGIAAGREADDKGLLAADRGGQGLAGSLRGRWVDRGCISRGCRGLGWLCAGWLLRWCRLVASQRRQLLQCAGGGSEVDGDDGTGCTGGRIQQPGACRLAEAFGVLNEGLYGFGVVQIHPGAA